MLGDAHLPVLGIVGFSGVGKTTLLVKLLPLLGAQGLRVAVIKHAPHGFDLDHPGKDSYVLREAGANPVVIASNRGWALLETTPTALRLDEVLVRLGRCQLDGVLVEGFKEEHFPKIELHRPSLAHPLLCTHDAAVIAVAADAPLASVSTIPVLDLNQPRAIAAFVVEHFGGASAGRNAAD